MNRLSITYAAATLAAIMLLAACCEADYSEQSAGQPVVLRAMQADAATNATTRTGASTTLIDGTVLPSGLKINGYLTDDNDGNAALIGSPTVWTTGSNGVITPSPQPYYPALAHHTVSAYALYPSTVTSSSTSFSVSATQTSDANYLASDLMYASLSGFTAASASHVLNFRHLLSKLVVNVTSTTCTIVTATLTNVARTVALTPATGTLGSTSNSGTVAILTGGTALTASCAAVVPPQTIATGTKVLTLTVTADGETYTVEYTLSSALKLESGKKYTLSFEVVKKVQSVVISLQSFTDWSSGGTITPTISV